MTDMLNTYLKRHQFSKSKLGSLDDIGDIDDLLNEVEDFAKREQSSCTAATEETFPEEISVTSSIEVSLITLENEDFNLWDKLRAIKEQGAQIENGITTLMKREKVFRSNGIQRNIKVSNCKKEKNSKHGRDKPALTKKEKQVYSPGASLRKGMISQQGIIRTPPGKALQHRTKNVNSSSSQNHFMSAEVKKQVLRSPQQGPKLKTEINKNIARKHESSRFSDDWKHPQAKGDRTVESSFRDDRITSKSKDPRAKILSFVPRKVKEENYGKFSFADTAYDLKAASIAAMKEHRQAIISAITLERSIFNEPARKYFISPLNLKVENMFSQHDTTFDDLSIIDFTQRTRTDCDKADGKLLTSTSEELLKYGESVPSSNKLKKGLSSVNPFNAIESIMNPSTEGKECRIDVGEAQRRESPILISQPSSRQHQLDNETSQWRHFQSHCTCSKTPSLSAKREEALISMTEQYDRQHVSRRLDISPETSNSNTKETEQGIEMFSTFQTTVCLNKSNDEQTVISVVSTLSTSTTHTRNGQNFSTEPLHPQSRYHHLYGSPYVPKKPRSAFLQERRARLQASSDDIFNRLYKLSQPMQQQGKELRRKFTASRHQAPRPRALHAQTNEDKMYPKLRSSLAFRDEKDIGTRLYKQGMLSMRKLEERRAQNMSRKTRHS
jgi:hypothetical protein